MSCEQNPTDLYGALELIRELRHELAEAQLTVQLYKELIDRLQTRLAETVLQLIHKLEMSPH